MYPVISRTASIGFFCRGTAPPNCLFRWPCRPCIRYRYDPYLPKTFERVDRKTQLSYTGLKWSLLSTLIMSWEVMEIRSTWAGEQAAPYFIYTFRQYHVHAGCWPYLSITRTVRGGKDWILNKCNKNWGAGWTLPIAGQRTVSLNWWWQSMDGSGMRIEYLSGLQQLSNHGIGVEAGVSVAYTPDQDICYFLTE